MAPNNASSIERVSGGIGQRPWGTVMLVAGNFNPDLVKSEGNARYEAISEAVETAGM